MGILSDFMKPKWKNEDIKIRHQAVMNMSEKQIDHLREIALTDTDENIAIIAMKKIHNIETLREIVEKSDRRNLQIKAEKKLLQLLREGVIKKHKCEYIDWIHEEKVLIEIITSTNDEDCQNKAFSKISSEEAFYKIALSLSNQTLVIKALENISKEEFLRNLTKKAKNKKIKRLAANKYKELYRSTEMTERVSDTKEEVDYSSELESMANYANKIKDTDDFEKFSYALAEKAKMWSIYDPYGASEFAPQFYSALKIFETRKNEYKEKLEADARNKRLHHELVEKKTALCQKIKTLQISQDTESIITDFRKQWLEIMPLDNEEEEKSFNEKFEEALLKLKEKIERFKEEQLKFNALTESFEKYQKILQSQSIDDIKKLLSSIPKIPKFKFIDSLKIKELENNFFKLKKEAKKIVSNFENKIKEENDSLVKELKEILSKIPPLMEEENPKSAADKMKHLQEKWKELNGYAIPKLTKSFKKLSDDFWKKQREYNEEEDWNRWANKNQKTALIHIVEKTSELSDMKKVASIIRQAQNKWKETGPVPRQDSDDMWNRFHKACEENYARCKTYFEQLDKEREENFEYCKSIVQKAEEIVQNEDIRLVVNTLKALNADWKKHSMLPKSKGDELYKQFRNICDEFFKKYGELKEDIDSHREENQTKRDDIIKKIKELIANKDFEIKKCIALQKEMQELGPGLKDKDKETWQEYRKACDLFFENIDKDREKNIPLKEAVYKELEDAITANKNKEDNKIELNILNNLIKKWRKIGPLPKKQDKTLSEKFYKLCAESLGLDLENIDITEEKTKMVENAENLVASTQWRDTTDALRLLQIKWNIMSYNSPGKDDELWKRFRTACDTFFNKKKEHFEKSDEQKQKNLIEKEGLITRIEMLVTEKHGKENEPEQSISTKQASISLADELQMAMENNFIVASISNSGMHDEIKRIQEQWKKIGYVPRDKENELWNRYKKALDAFYDNEKNKAEKN